MNFTIEIEQEDDGRWLAEVIDLPGVLAYGQAKDEALAKVQALGLRVIADRLEHGEATPALMSVAFRADGRALGRIQAKRHRARAGEIWY